MKRIITSILFIASIISTTKAQDKILFKINPIIGEKNSYVVKNLVSMEDTEDSVDITFKIDQTAKSLTDSVIDIAFKITNLKVNSGLLGINYDSKDEPKNEESMEIHNSWKLIMDSVLNYKISQSGEIIKGLDIHDENGISDKISLDAFVIQYPKKPIGIGDSWENKVFLKEAQKDIIIKYTYLENTEKGYKIGSELLFGEKEKQIGMQATGTAFINQITHIVEEYELSLSVEFMGINSKSSYQVVK